MGTPETAVMKPATRLHEIVAGLYEWSSFHPQWKVEFNSHALRTSAGVVFIDPLQPGPAVLKKLTALGEPFGVFLTSASHERDAGWFRKHFEIQVYAHEKAKPDCDIQPDVLVLDGEKLPGGVRAVALPGSGAGETGYYTELGGGILLLGDALLHLPKQGLSLLPEQYCEDVQQARRSLARLADLHFKVMAFAHGAPITVNAKRQFLQFFEETKKQKKKS